MVVLLTDMAQFLCFSLFMCENDKHEIWDTFSNVVLLPLSDYENKRRLSMQWLESGNNIGSIYNCDINQHRVFVVLMYDLFSSHWVWRAAYVRTTTNSGPRLFVCKTLHNGNKTSFFIFSFWIFELSCDSSSEDLTGCAFGVYMLQH